MSPNRPMRVRAKVKSRLQMREGREVELKVDGRPAERWGVGYPAPARVFASLDAGDFEATIHMSPDVADRWGDALKAMAAKVRAAPVVDKEAEFRANDARLEQAIERSAAFERWRAAGEPDPAKWTVQAAEAERGADG